jgi:hypothetical protein
MIGWSPLPLARPDVGFALFTFETVDFVAQALNLLPQFPVVRFQVFNQVE